MLYMQSLQERGVRKDKMYLFLQNTGYRRKQTKKKKRMLVLCSLLMREKAKQRDDSQ